MERYELETPWEDVFDIINIIAHNPCKNKSIKMTKNNQPPKGEKGPWKGELVRRLLRGK